MVNHTRMRSWPMAKAVTVVFGAIVAVIVLGIALVLLGANTQNELVHLILRIGGWFSTPFHHLFPQPNVKQDTLVNWGIAAVAYFVVGGVVARLVP